MKPRSGFGLKRIVIWHKPCSFLNCLDTTLPEVLEVVVHFLELGGGVAGPIRNLADDAKWIPGTV
jgi:hypothetical protein